MNLTDTGEGGYGPGGYTPPNWGSGYPVQTDQGLTGWEYPNPSSDTDIVATGTDTQGSDLPIGMGTIPQDTQGYQGPVAVYSPPWTPPGVGIGAGTGTIPGGTSTSWSFGGLQSLFTGLDTPTLLMFLMAFQGRNTDNMLMLIVMLNMMNKGTAPGTGPGTAPGTGPTTGSNDQYVGQNPLTALFDFRNLLNPLWIPNLLRGIGGPGWAPWN